jgi:hypothetical protein
MPYGSSYKAGGGVGAEQSTAPERPSSGSGSPMRGATSSTLPSSTIDEKRKTDNAPLKFPDDLPDNFYISFNTYKYAHERPGEATRSNLFAFQKSIVLPLPTNLTDSFSAGYSSENLFYAGDAIKNQLSTDLRKEGIGGTASSYASKAGLNKLVGSAMDTIKNTDPGQLALGLGVFGLSGMPGPTAAAVKSSLQLTTNPFPVMIFQGTTFKPAFSFDWVFYPESSSEAATLQKIVGYFRKEMLPERMENNNSILKAPSIFEIKITPIGIGRTFKRCVLTNMGVNYAPSGLAFVAAQENEERYPAAISISLTFQEIEVWLANDYRNEEEFLFSPRAEFTK